MPNLIEIQPKSIYVDFWRFQGGRQKCVKTRGFWHIVARCLFFHRQNGRLGLHGTYVPPIAAWVDAYHGGTCGCARRKQATNWPQRFWERNETYVDNWAHDSQSQLQPPNRHHRAVMYWHAHFHPSTSHAALFWSADPLKPETRSWMIGIRLTQPLISLLEVFLSFIQKTGFWKRFAVIQAVISSIWLILKIS